MTSAVDEKMSENYFKRNLDSWIILDSIKSASYNLRLPHLSRTKRTEQNELILTSTIA